MVTVAGTPVNGYFNGYKNVTMAEGIQLSFEAQRDEEFRNGFPFFGERLWIDLLNTTPFDGERRQDLVETSDGFAKWLEAAGIPAPPSHGLPTARDDARKVREKLRSTFEDLRAGSGVQAPVLQWVNARLRNVRLRLALEQDGEGVRLVERLDLGASGPSGAIARDFACFICDYEPARLKRCANPACTMVFYDTGKNNTRRWCTMSICGNRDKVARYRARKSHRTPAKR